MSYLGHSNGALGRNSIGIVVFAPGENLKFVKSLTKPIFVCISPNLKPAKIEVAIKQLAISSILV
jgi:hypothetical protein